MKIYFVAFVTAACLLNFVKTFCVYNNSPDNSLYVRQMPFNTVGTYYSRFKRENLEPGQSACCHFTSTDCNQNGDPDSVVIIAFQPNFEGKDRDYMFTVTVPASGWITLSAKGNKDPEIEVHNADGSPMQYELQSSPRGILLN
ncbi:unnamed protein product [Mucor hiemalis]